MGHNFYGEPAQPDDILYSFPPENFCCQTQEPTQITYENSENKENQYLCYSYFVLFILLISFNIEVVPCGLLAQLQSVKRFRARGVWARCSNPIQLNLVHGRVRSYDVLTTHHPSLSLNQSPADKHSYSTHFLLFSTLPVQSSSNPQLNRGKRR